MKRFILTFLLRNRVKLRSFSCLSFFFKIFLMCFSQCYNFLPKCLIHWMFLLNSFCHFISIQQLPIRCLTSLPIQREGCLNSFLGKIPHELCFFRIFYSDVSGIFLNLCKLCQFLHSSSGSYSVLLFYRKGLSSQYWQGNNSILYNEF